MIPYLGLFAGMMQAGRPVIRMATASGLRTSLKVVNGLVVVDVAGGLWTGEDVFIDDDLILAVSAASLAALGGKMAILGAGKLRSLKEARKIKETLAAQMKKTKPGSPEAADIARAMEESTRQVVQAASHFKTSGVRQHQLFISSQLPRIRTPLRDFKLTTIDGPIYNVVRDAKNNAYMVIGKSGALMLTLSVAGGLEVAQQFGNNVEVLAPGTSAGLELLQSTDGKDIASIASHLEDIATVLDPDEAIAHNASYSEVMNASATDLLRDPGFYVSRLANSRGTTFSEAESVYIEEIRSILDGNKYPVLSMADKDARQDEGDSWFEGLVENFLGIFDPEGEKSSVDPVSVAKQMYEATTTAKQIVDGADTSKYNIFEW
jgi:hypothetical protein